MAVEAVTTAEVIKRRFKGRLLSQHRPWRKAPSLRAKPVGGVFSCLNFGSGGGGQFFVWSGFVRGLSACGWCVRGFGFLTLALFWGLGRVGLGPWSFGPWSLPQ